MSMITGAFAEFIRQPVVLVIAILIITTVAIIAGIILDGLLPAQDTFRADLILVVKNLIIPVPTGGSGLP